MKKVSKNFILLLVILTCGSSLFGMKKNLGKKGMLRRSGFVQEGEREFGEDRILPKKSILTWFKCKKAIRKSFLKT